jgi:hypothetical protein
MLNGITFSIPEEKIVKDIPNKSKILSNLIPGNLSTYIYNDEEDYYSEYKKSLFAMTIQKGGWDCMRHYEILLNGCIPYFPNIENCPENTMKLFPKDLILEGNILFEKYRNYDINNLEKDDINECNILIKKLLEYTNQYLTTKNMAKYILEKTNNTNISNILYLSGNMNPDYLRSVTLHGFKELFGSKCHDYPKVSYIYKSENLDYKKLYGKGITYTNLLNDCLHDDTLDKTIENDIRNKKYDIIIYGSYHRGTPFYELVCNLYTPDKIILLCGEDIHNCDCLHYVNKGHCVFVRELNI